MKRFLSFGLFVVFVASLGAFYTGVVSTALLPPVTLGFLFCSLVIYTTSYHQFGEKGVEQTAIAALFGLGAVLSAVWAAGIVVYDRFDIFAVPSLEGPTAGSPLPDEFLPEWWLAVLFGVVVLIVLYDVLVTDGNRYRYASPRGWEELTQTPLYFGFLIGFFGLWGVLFVFSGTISRIIVVAPVFEELFKFGLALFVGTALFGRTVYARIAVALLVGMLFGVVEHAITYSFEPDTVYLFRVLFHGTMTALAVAVFTKFEQYNFYGIMWTAPILSIGFHFAYNTFVVVVSILFADPAIALPQYLPMFFGGMAIVFSSAWILAAIKELDIVLDLHESIYYFGKL